MKPDNQPLSPCIGICVLNTQDLCSGCLRSRAEITAWFSADDAEKREILKTVAARKAETSESAA